MPDSLADRIDVNSIPEPNSGCSLWLGTLSSTGYPHIKVKGQTRRVNRLVWESRNGPIPEGLHVLHRCDNPACVNLDHLRIGTHQDNMNDKVAKGRQPFGDICSRKLTEAQVAKIKTDRRPQNIIAAAYGVSKPYISRIKSGKKRRLA